MSDKYTIKLRNFRSIRDATVDLAPLNVIYGKNGSGKSSLLYGLLTMRNFLSNPNQNLPSLFSYPSISLGGFQEIVHRHDSRLLTEMSFGVSSSEKLSATFRLGIEDAGGQVGISFNNSSLTKGFNELFNWEMPSELDLQIPFPYAGGQLVGEPFSVDPLWIDEAFLANKPVVEGMLDWNGLSVLLHPQNETPEMVESITALSMRTNLPMNVARQTGFVPLRRGFSKPTYNYSSVSPYLLNEDEVASSLAPPEDRYRHYKVSDYFEGITNCRVNVQGQPGAPVFMIDVIPNNRSTPNSIVNEGFGLNQLLYLLTICLNPNYKLVAIEEPEIHLHPSMVRLLARTLADIAQNEERSLIVSTHSEAFVVALLSQLAAGKLPVESVSFLLAEKRNGETVFEKCEANEMGQISGGLKPFMAEEMEDIAAFLGIEGQIG